MASLRLSYIILNFAFGIVLVFGQDVIYHTLEDAGEARKVSQRYIGTVSTNAKLKEIVGENDFTNLRYSFLTTGSRFTSLFYIDEKTSELYTSGFIDRETLCEYSPICVINLDIAAQSTIGSFFKKIKVAIYVDDLNDNSPKFAQELIHESISEAVLVGTSITIEGARDRDTSEQFSLQNYTVIGSSPSEKIPFNISFEKKLDGTSKVKLIVSQALNREEKDSYQLNIIASDGGITPQNGTLKVNITITDVNDNPPMFNKSSYSVTVKEDVNISTVILQLTASDPDQGKNGQIFYRLSPHQSETILKLFSINNITGELSVEAPLIYVPGNQYGIIIEASDRGDQPLSSQTFVHVTILDAGNSKPTINVNVLSGADVSKISEYANTGAVVAHIAVKDSDTGPNGQVSCFLNNSNFELKPLEVNVTEYKVTVAQTLDREKQEIHYIQISCQDKGSPPLNTSEIFRVEVEDENDNTPIFSATTYSGHIRENNEIGEVIRQVTATDLDLGQNGQIRYYIPHSETSLFEVDSVTGVVRSTTVFDREKMEKISTVILAVDLGNPANTGTAELVVTIDDVNDETPKFTETEFIFKISENLQTGKIVGRLTATDMDSGDNAKIVFSAYPPTPPTMPFVVFPDGVIKADRELDREDKSQYDFIVIASDLGFPSLNSSARVKITVTDQNDNAPVISWPSKINNSVYIGVKKETGSVITRVKAHDPDEGTNSELTYYIESRNDSDIFDLTHDTGELLLKSKLDPHVGKLFRFDIIVSDRGQVHKSSRTTLNIIVLSPVPAKQSNFVIVIVLVTITIILSTVIIMIICVLRKIDRNRQMKESKLYTDSKYDPGVGVFSLPSDESIEKKKKKEVSFSIDDDEQYHSDPLNISLKNNNISFDGKDFEVSLYNIIEKGNDGKGR